MYYKILTDYDISEDKNMVATFILNGVMVEITISKSITSDVCFISIKENGSYIVQNKVCTSREFIMSEARQLHNSSLGGDFFFTYTTEGMENYDFDYRNLGKHLFLFFYDAEVR